LKGQLGAQRQPSLEVFMTARKRPLSVTAVALLYIAVGTLLFAYDVYAIAAARSVPGDMVLAALTEAAAVASGAFMLRGARWAQWLALAWIALHVAISLGSLQQATVHGILFIVIAGCLLHREARAYFRNVTVQSTA
jgi:hypothetical protein